MVCKAKVKRVFPFLIFSEIDSSLILSLRASRNDAIDVTGVEISVVRDKR